MQAHRVLFWAVLEMLNNTERLPGVESAAEASEHIKVASIMFYTEG
jgi:hypothetical protein